MVRITNKLIGRRPVWQDIDGYKATAAGVAGLLTLFFLLATIMPIVLFQTVENLFRAFTIFATSYRPLAALIGLALFLPSGWAFVHVVRTSQILAGSGRRAMKPEPPASKSTEATQASAEAKVSA
jgi:hypothetical protein